jgi:hypothetical protein
MKMNKKSPPPPSPPRLPPPNHPPPTTSSLAKSVLDGIAVGTGSAIAREAIERLLDKPKSTPVYNPISLFSCDLLQEQLRQCSADIEPNTHCDDVKNKYKLLCDFSNRQI